MKKLNLYSPIRYQRRNRIENIINHTIDWCVDKWGLTPHECDLELNICYKEEMTDGLVTKAEYCNEFNEIVIYPSNNTNIRDLVDSVIHEFTHQRQDMSKYHDILHKNGYDDHPLEVEANKIAKNNRKKCWYDIKHLINV